MCCMYCIVYNILKIIENEHLAETRGVIADGPFCNLFFSQSHISIFKMTSFLEFPLSRQQLQNIQEVNLVLNKLNSIKK